MNTMVNDLALRTDTDAGDWEELDGPETGVGVERWFIHIPTALEAYCCDDQGHLKIDCPLLDD